jgi:hypothetical protein
MSLTDAQKRMLQEDVLGEPWHTVYDSWGNPSATPNRTFTSDWNDLRDLKTKLVEKGWWAKFIGWIPEHWWRQMEEEGTAEFINWIFTMPHFAELVAEWWEGRGK